MQCPQCKLYNPDGAMRCDCGYDFDTKKFEGSLLGEVATKPSNGLVIAGWVFSILGGWIGIVISCMILFGKNGSVYKYDPISRRTGRRMLAVAIFMTLVTILYRIAMIY